MSIILDALKKSEAQRRLGKAPTLADTTPFGALPELQRRQRRWYLALLPVLLVAAYLLWVQTARESEAPSPAMSTELKPGPEPVPESVKADVPSPPEGERTPVERYNEPDSKVLSQSADAAEHADSDPEGGDVAVQSVKKSAAEEAGPEPEAVLAAKGNPDSDGVAVGTEPLSIYELPRSVRADIPEIKVTMLVYANNPDDRYALVNGRRMKAGSELSPGLRVEEIRRQAIVFSFRNYRFAVGD